MHHIAGNHNGIATEASRLRRQNAKEAAAKDFADANADAHQADNFLGRRSYFRGEANGRTKNAAEERKLQT